MKDAYLAARAGELHLVINSLKSIIELNPELSKEWDSYIVKLKTLLENQKKDGENRFLQDYIEKKQHETIPDYSHVLQLGMTYKEVEKIRGTPKFVDEISDANQYFQMWTYPATSQNIRLYFEGNTLIRIYCITCNPLPFKSINLVFHKCQQGRNYYR